MHSVDALWSPAGNGLTSRLSFVMSKLTLSLSHWYSGSGVVLDCIDSYLPSFLLRTVWYPLVSLDKNAFNDVFSRPRVPIDWLYAITWLFAHAHLVWLAFIGSHWWSCSISNPFNRFIKSQFSVFFLLSNLVICIFSRVRCAAYMRYPNRRFEPRHVISNNVAFWQV